LAAYKKGDFSTALREWTPLVKQGNAVAQYYLGFMYRAYPVDAGIYQG